MWGASLIVLLQGGFSCLVIGLVLLFSLPADGQVVGPNLPYLPVSVSALIFLSAVLSIVIAQKNQNVASGQHNKAGMAILAVGFALWAIGVIAFCLFVFGELPGGPDPKAAVITFSTLTLAGAVSLYFSTRYETVRFPNIYRWLTFWASIIMLSAILACSMIFIYAFPGDQPVAHTFWASLNSLNYVPMALLFIGLNQGYVKRKRVDKIIEPAADASEFIFE